jgi:hypothetical protein
MPAKTPAFASKRNLALIMPDKQSGVGVYTLYDPSALVNLFKFVFDKVKEHNKGEDLDALKSMTAEIISNGDYFKSKKKDFIVATVGVMRTPADAGVLYGASKVFQSAARLGYGPMLYDIAMHNENGLTSDRASVSDEAKKIWSYYFSSRSDVTKKKLVKHDNSTHSGKSRLFDEKKDNPLDYVYYIKSQPNYQPLIINHEKFVSWVKRNLPDINIDIASSHFFDRLYTQ